MGFRIHRHRQPRSSVKTADISNLENEPAKKERRIRKVRQTCSADCCELDKPGTMKSDDKLPSRGADVVRQDAVSDPLEDQPEQKSKRLPASSHSAVHHGAFVKLVKLTAEKIEQIMLENDLTLNGGQPQRIGLLINGWTSSKRAKKLKRVRNTCTADSFFQIVACCYRDHKQFKDFYLKEKLRCQTSGCWTEFFEFIDFFLQNKIQLKTYNLRNAVLEKLYSAKEINRHIQIDCTCNVEDVQRGLFANTLPSLIIKTTCVCGNFFERFGEMPINENDLHGIGIAGLTAAISTSEREHANYQNRIEMCSTCSSPKSVEYELSPMLIIDVQYYNTNLEWNSEPIRVDSIPNTIVLQQKTYKLKCIVEWILAGKYEHAHYVAHCLRNGTWFEYDDLQSKVHKSDYTINPHSLVFIKL